MSSLKLKKLLLITPHFKTFIKDQSMLIRPSFYNMTVLMPIPYFSSLALKLPRINKYFSFLKVIVESRNQIAQNYTLISPKFFTLPIEVLRKRNCYLSTRSCITALSKNSVDFNLIHAHFLDSGFIGTILKDQHNVPLVVTAHGGDFYDLPFRNNWYNALARYVLSEADQVITVSQSNAKKLSLLGISSNKLHVIPNGFNETLFKPISLIAARKKLGLPINKKVLLTVGNLVDVKGHKYLIDAMQIVLKKRSDTILIIVGSGSLRNNLQKKVNGLDLDEKIFHVGGKKHEEIPLWMNACDIFILPSLNESFGTVILEAMACGKPVIGTQVGGIPEIITRDDIGILVNPANPKSLSDGILKALDRKWVSKSIINYSKQFSWTIVVQQILKIYSDILKDS